MGHSDYPLQALLYAVVLHRFLRWRLPGYDPRPHLGGVLYLYLRGMCGPATPRRRRRARAGSSRGEPPVALVDGAVRPARREWRADEPTSSSRSTPPTPASRWAPTGLLGAFNAAGVLTAADVHVATRLGRLGGESDERVLLAVALAVRAVRGGSVCLDLATVARPRAATCRGPSPTPGRAPSRPARWSTAGVLRWEHGLLYLDRYHEQETQVVDDLLSRGRHRARPDAVRRGPRWTACRQQSARRRGAAPSYDEQRAACLAAAGQWTTVITGGPGTGKTTAVAGAARRAARPGRGPRRRLRIALAAPTGKAAARLQQAVAPSSAAAFGEADRARLAGVTAIDAAPAAAARPGQHHPLPPPPRQPAAPRRRRRRRVARWCR